MQQIKLSSRRSAGNSVYVTKNVKVTYSVLLKCLNQSACLSMLSSQCIWQEYFSIAQILNFIISTRTQSLPVIIYQLAGFRGELGLMVNWVDQNAHKN